MTSAPPAAIQFRDHRQRQAKRQRLITFGALILLVAAWLYGFAARGIDYTPFVPNVLPGAARIERKGDLFVGYAGDQLIGYAGVGTAQGYGGPLSVMVGINEQGAIIGVQVISNKETPGFFRLLKNTRFLDQFVKLGYQNEFVIGRDLDGASSATLSSEGVANSVRQAVRALTVSELGKTPPLDQRPIHFGVPEVTLIALFAVGYVVHRSHHRQIKQWGRWATLLVGMVVLGFIFNKPFTLANVISFLSGFWPDWQTNLYWFLLLGGIVLVTSAQGKNPYCSWFCPFGAVQETLGKLTGAKLYRPRRLDAILLWLQRGLAFGAIVLGLAFRQPGAASYEPFGTLFNLNGTWPQWALLILVLLGSLVVYRPFCNYLCPLDPVVDYIGEIRRWVKSTWQQLRKTPDPASSNKAF